MGCLRQPGFRGTLCSGIYMWGVFWGAFSSRASARGLEKQTGQKDTLACLAVTTTASASPVGALGLGQPFGGVPK